MEGVCTMKQMAFTNSYNGTEQISERRAEGGTYYRDQVPSKPFAHALLFLDDAFKRKFDMPILSCEGRMLAYVLTHDNVSVKELMVNTPVSSRTFFQRLKFLRKHGILVEKAAESDRRVKNLTVGHLELIP